MVSDPLFMGILAALVVSLPEIWPRIFAPLRFALPLSIALLGLGFILKSDSPFQNRTKDKISMVETALRLTEPSDYVMDSKGETIYRRRPFYYVLEGLTGKRMKAGLIPDTIPERLVETETPLTTVRRMPSKAADFIRKNYLPIAFRLSVLGKILTGADENSASISRFPVFTRLSQSSDQWREHSTVRAFAGRHAWSAGITKFEG